MISGQVTEAITDLNKNFTEEALTTLISEGTAFDTTLEPSAATSDYSSYETSDFRISEVITESFEATKPSVTSEFSTEDRIELSTNEPSESTENHTAIPEKTIEEFDFSSLLFEAHSDSSAILSEQVTERDEIVELTSQFHILRVKIANYTHVIQAQQKLITKLSETVRDLEFDVTKLKATNEKESKEFLAKNEKYKKDFNNLMSELKAAKRLVAMEMYSKELRNQLKEFGVLDKSRRV